MPITNPAVLQAIKAIGENKDGDHSIRPTQHAAAYLATAPALAAVLDSGAVASNCRAYEKRGVKAKEAQTEFRRIFNRANKLVMATAILTALVLTVGVLSPYIQPVAKTLLLALAIGGVVCGAFASKDLYSVRQGRLLEEWMTKRAAAESKRLEHFSEIAKAGDESDTALQLQKLEYFRRYQLDVQLAFFDKRGQDHRNEARENLKQSGLAISGAAIVTGVAGVLTSVSPAWAALASLGAVFTAYSSYTTLREQIYQSGRIADRYALAADSLEEIAKRLDDVREAVSREGQKPLVRFVEAVHDVLIAEHKQWLGEGEQRSSTLVRLDDLLQKALPQKKDWQQGAAKNEKALSTSTLR